MTNQSEADLKELLMEYLSLAAIAQEIEDRDEVENLLERAAAVQERLEALQGVECDV